MIADRDWLDDRRRKANAPVTWTGAPALLTAGYPTNDVRNSSQLVVWAKSNVR